MGKLTCVVCVLLVVCVTTSYSTDLVSTCFDIDTQARCTEVTNEAPLRDRRWHAGLNVFVDQHVMGGRIIAFKLQWFSGRWSNWFVTGVNDIDHKVNLGATNAPPFSSGPNTMRRWWSNFYDHYHTYIICYTPTVPCPDTVDYSQCCPEEDCPACPIVENPPVLLNISDEGEIVPLPPVAFEPIPVDPVQAADDHIPLSDTNDEE